MKYVIALLTALLVMGGAAAAQNTYDDTDSSIIYSSTVVSGDGWTAASGATGDYDGTHHYSNGCVSPPQTATSVQGPMAAINFVGTSITLFGEKGTNFGIGAYALDGGALSTVDAYGSTHLYQQALVSLSGLANEPHVLTYQVTCNKNAASSGFYQVVDAYTVTGTNNPLANAAQNSDGAGNITLGGSGWTCATGNAQDISGSQCWDGTAGDSIQYTFTGSLAEVYIRPDVGDGYFDVQIDGATVAHDVSGQYTTADNDQLDAWMAFAEAGLSSGTHTIKLIVDGSAPYPNEAENSGQKNLLQFDVGLAFAATAGATSTPTPASTATPSPNCSTITTVGPTITDASGNKWAFNSSFQATENGSVFDNSGANLQEMVYSSGSIAVGWQNTEWWYSTPAGANFSNETNAAPACGVTRANDFLGIFGYTTHHGQGKITVAQIERGLTYTGVRHIRDDGTNDPSLLADYSSIHLRPSKILGKRLEQYRFCVSAAIGHPRHTIVLCAICSK